MSAGGGPSSLLPFTLVTGNPDKRAEAARILGHAVDCVPLDLPELQSLDLLVVLREKAAVAFRALRRPLVVEETGLELEALHGFPGPLVKWMLQEVGAEGIARVGLALGAPGVIARCALLWTDGEREILGTGATHGTLVTPRGEQGFGWDPVFLPDGESRTYGELPPADKDRTGHRGRAWRDLAAKLAPQRETEWPAGPA